MGDQIPATFEEAKELARRQMLAEQQAQDLEDDATPSQPPITDTEDPEPEEQADDPVEEPEDEDVEADDDDDEADEVPDAAESDGDDEDADTEPEPRAEREPGKRKASRRSKRVSRLEQKNAELEAKIADFEANREASEERLLERLQQEQARRAALEADQRRREAEDRQIEAEMQEHLGSDEEYQAAINAALEGDVMAQERARGWHEKRQVFSKLSRRAEARVNQRAAEIFWDATKDLPSVDREVLQKSPFGDVLKHLHAAGVAAEAGRQAKEIEKRDREIARLKGLLKESKPKAVAAAAKRGDPLEGGAPIAPRPQQDPYADMMDPATGRIDRKKYEAFLAAQRQKHLVE